MGASTTDVIVGDSDLKTSEVKNASVLNNLASDPKQLNFEDIYIIETGKVIVTD